MKNGLFSENGEKVYYKDDKPFHAGVIEVDGDIYYIGHNGIAVKGVHVVHGSMSNGILKRGTYKFGEDGKLIKGSYIAPKRHSNGNKNKKHLSRKKNTVVLVCVSVISLAIIVSLAVLSKFEGKWSRFDEKEESSQEVVVPDLILQKPEGEVALCTAEFMRFYNGEASLENVLPLGNPHTGLTIKYKINNGQDGVFLISENENMENAKTLELPWNNRELNIKNLKTDTVYCYRASCGDTVIEGSFKTLPSNRFVSIDGLKNARDIGGYETTSGKTVKQGKIIRGGEIDGLVVSTHFLTKEDSKAFAEDFGFVYDFDLRSPTIFIGEHVSHFGENVKQEFYNFPVYGGIFSESNKQIVKKAFTDLANKDNYPMYLHCTHGADRTGVLVYLIQGILGVSEEDMIKEYRLTAFYSGSYVNNENINVVISALNNYEGDTMNEKVENYLINFVGVTEEEIESVRNILLE